MPMPLHETTTALALTIVTVSASLVLAQTSNHESARVGVGNTPSEELVQAWNIDISPDGENLPSGSGSVAEGEQVYNDMCLSCHGPEGTASRMDRLAGGEGSLSSDSPLRTVGSYWPYATTLFDYIHRAMPFNNPQSLTDEQVYAVTAYVLNLNDIVEDDAVMDANSLPNVEMPNHGSFEQMNTVTLAETEACMENCEPLDIEAKVQKFSPGSE